ncbi:hypothetical protein SDC9_158458 [bioreactor metagenome]|uniref:Uncharacterized protein n=1 Tax=bioreactor metagenome TaxID=1076179 RepID=A0A645FA74_9ZZZZ
MPFVGGYDGHKIHPFFFGQEHFFFEHLLIGSVYSVVGEKIFPSGTPGYFRIYAETTAYQFNQIVHKSSVTMNCPNKSITSATNHTHFKFFLNHDTVH